MFTGENEFKAHVCSEKMKCSISDSLKNAKEVGFAGDASLLLRNTARGANVHLFNSNFTSITHSCKFAHVDSLQCTSHFKRENSFSLFYTSKGVFHAYNLSLKNEGESSVEEIEVKANLEQNDDFKLLSPAIALSEREEALIAYTEKDEFYLCLMEVKGRQRALRCLKLKDLNRPSGIMTWLTRQKAPHFQNIKILPILKIDANYFRILCIRDNSAGVFNVSFDEKQGSIKQAYICNALEKEIGKGDILLSALALSNTDVLLAYSIKEKLCLIKMKISNDESSITIDSYKTSIPVDGLRILASKQNIYISIYDDNQQTFKCFRTARSDLQSLTSAYQKIQPFLQSMVQLEFTTNSRQFFIISYHKIYVIQDDYNLYHNRPQQAIKIEAYENFLERIYNKKIKKMVQQGLYVELEQLCAEKERKLIEQFNKVKNAIVKERLAQLIIFTHIIQIIVSHNDFQVLLKSIDHPNIENNTNNGNLLENALIEQSQESIKQLLKVILHMKLFRYLNTFLEAIFKHSHMKYCRDTINSIFSDVCEQAIHSFPLSKNYNLKEYKQLIVNTFDLIHVNEGNFLQEFFLLAKNNQNSTFLRNQVLNYNLIQCFMHLFLNTNIEFEENDVTEIVSSLNETARQIYLNHFFTALRAEYVKQQSIEQENDSERVNLKKRCAILMKGLLNFREEIEGIVKNTFPGLCVFLYLKHNKKYYSNEIKAIAQRCQNPNISYMLHLSSIDQPNSSNLQSLERLRLQAISAINQPSGAIAQQNPSN